MSETITAPSTIEQPKVELSAQEKVSARISADFGGDDIVTPTVVTPSTEPTQLIKPETNAETTETTTDVVELTAEEKTALINEAKELGLPETSTKEEIEKFKTEKADDSTWKLEDAAQSSEEPQDGTWGGLITNMGYELPEDFSEEKGFEIVQSLKQAEIETARREAIAEASYERFADVPEEHRAEAEMIVELMKSGQTLASVNAPFEELAQIKAMNKEELVRFRLENKEGWDTEMVDREMEKLIEDGAIDVEYKIAKAQLDGYEKSLNHERQVQIENYHSNQQKVQEQRFKQESLKLAVALDGVQEFLGKKLPNEIKPQLLQEMADADFHNLPGTPEDRVDYFLYKKLGKTAMKNFQARALEKVVLENKQSQHNVPIVQTGNVNRVEGSSEKTIAEQRIEREYGS